MTQQLLLLRGASALAKGGCLLRGKRHSLSALTEEWLTTKPCAMEGWPAASSLAEAWEMGKRQSVLFLPLAMPQPAQAASFALFSQAQKMQPQAGLGPLLGSSG